MGRRSSIHSFDWTFSVCKAISLSLSHTHTHSLLPFFLLLPQSPYVQNRGISSYFFYCCFYFILKWAYIYVGLYGYGFVEASVNVLSVSYEINILYMYSIHTYIAQRLTTRDRDRIDRNLTLSLTYLQQFPFIHFF